MLRCGKYRGQTRDYVIEHDRSYCAWLLRARREKQALPRDLDKFAAHLALQHGGILTVGIHKGKFYDEMLIKHADYCDWAAELADPSDGMKSFAQYVLEQRRASTNEEEEGSKAGGAKEGVCCICWTRKTTCAFVPCGHARFCRPCAMAVERDGCPVCRAEINMVLDIFT